MLLRLSKLTELGMSEELVTGSRILHVRKQIALQDRVVMCINSPRAT